MAQSVVLKKTTEYFPVGLKFYSPDLQSGETISAITVTITPTGTGALVADGSPVISGDEVSQMVKDGVAGIDYTVLFKVTTSSGKIWNHPLYNSVLVRVS